MASKSTTMGLSQIKGLRTRYRNLLQRELDKVEELMNSDVQDDDLPKELKKVSFCKTKLVGFYDKFIEADDKLIKVMIDSEPTSENLEPEKDCLDYTEMCGKITESISELTVREHELKDRKVSTFPEHSDAERHLEKLVKIQSQFTQQLLESHQIQIQTAHPSSDGNTNVQLPKIDLPSFDGDILKWNEFWDSFDVTIHSNSNLSNVEKLTYLKSKLSSDALCTISGLSLSHQNYKIAIELLIERYGNKQTAINTHYTQLLDLPACSDSTTKLRVLYNTMENHLRSLEALGQNTDQQIFVSIITSKLPRDLLVQLELQKGSCPWSIKTLRHLLKSNLTARETADRLYTPTSHAKSKAVIHESQTGYTTLKSSAETLVANGKQTYSTNHVPNTGCTFCGEFHWADECPIYPSIELRKQKIKGHCYICLRKGHSYQSCKVDKPCFFCNQRKNHHRSLCPKKFQLRSTEQSNCVISSDELTSETAMIASGQVVLMQTATTQIKDSEGCSTKTVRLLLDSGSHRTYITEKLVNLLKLQISKDKEQISLMTFGSENPQVISTPTVALEIKLKDGTFMAVTANVVPQITGAIHRMPVDLQTCDTWHFLCRGISLADTIPVQSEASTLDLLIGNDYYLDIVLPEKIQLLPGLYLLGSRLGWILSGRPERKVQHEASEMSMIVLSFGSTILSETVKFTPPDKSVLIKPNLEDFWKLESIGILDPHEHFDDETARHTFNETVTMSNGRYYVTWPWKDSELELPPNRELAFYRLKSLMRKLKKHPDLLSKYHHIIKEQESKGIIERVESLTKTSQKQHYIPHHAVVTPDKATTKVRIVYDASAKINKMSCSLNECLYRGPVILQDLCGMLIRFRTQPIAVTADIEKAFLQVGLQEAERDVTRFFWLKDPTLPPFGENLQVYRFQRVPFGIVSSPFLLGATILFHLNKVGTHVAKQLSDNLYVDNVITGCQNVTSAVKLYSEAKQIFRSASMNLREWSSNSSDFVDQLPHDDRCGKTKFKVLGVLWDTNDDCLSIPSHPPSVSVPGLQTKRTILQRVASIFDPTGLVSPITLQAKIFLQKLWREKVDWDDPLSEENCLEYERVSRSLEIISSMLFPRCIAPLSSNQSRTFQLLCFCDASTQAYSTAVYIRPCDNNNQAHLLLAKTRIATIKQITVPQLELLATVIGIRCLNFVRSQLGARISQRFLWTDSQCVLHWLVSNRPLSVFVGNRIKEIQKEDDVTHRYVPSQENPADLATRGNFNVDDHMTKWLHGPDWLSQPQDFWPQWTPSNHKIDEHQSGTTEVKLVATETSSKYVRNEPPLDIDIFAYSSLNKLLRVTSWCLRFIAKLRKQPSVQGPLTPKEIEQATILWEKSVQSHHYGDVIQSLNLNKPNNLARQLGLELDEHDILRCHGRLINADLTYGARLPKLLPKRYHFSTLVIVNIHNCLFHCGTSQTLSSLRQNYWIPQGRAAVKSILKTCNICRKHEGGHYRMPDMAPLPKQRVTQSLPFTYTGVDYLGPLFIKSGTGPVKVWVCLFTCIVTRALHLEIILDMSTDQFILCFRRFIARFGKPRRMISDNAPHFKLTKSVLEKAWHDLVHDPDVVTYAGKEGIDWHFIIQFAPWMGGFYERLVGLVKRCLRKAIGKVCLTYVQLETLLAEIQSVVNSRPLVYVDDDINSHITLTPSHFLVQNVEIGVPDLSDNSDPDYIPNMSSADKMLQVWKKGQKLLDRFWQSWKNDYLLSLRERTQVQLKGHRIQQQTEPNVGDVILVKDNLPRAAWKIGRTHER